MSSRKWQESVILENIRTVILPENEFMTQYTLLKRIGSASVNGRKTPENLTKTPRIRWRGVRVYAQNKMAGVHVRRKIISRRAV